MIQRLSTTGKIIVGFSAVLGVILAFLALVPEAKRCEAARAVGSDVLCPYPTTTAIHTPRPTAPISPTPTILFEENFEDGHADGITLTNGIWEVVADNSKNWVMSGKSVSVTSNPFISIGKLSWKNYAVEMQFNFLNTVPKDDQMGLETQILTQDEGFANGFLFAIYNYFGSAKRKQNEWLDFNSISANLSPNTWNTLYVESYDGLIRGSLNGQWLPNRQDKTYTHGSIRVILQPSQKTPLYFDNIRVWSLD